MHKKFVVIVLLAGVLGGCQDFKKKHPDFPKWGWWDKKTPATQPAKVTDSKPDSKTVRKAKKPPATKPTPTTVPVADQPKPVTIKTAKPGPAPVPVADQPKPVMIKPAKPGPTAVPAAGQPKPVMIKTATTKPSAHKPTDHRERVWRHVSKLRDSSDYPPEEQKKMIAYAQENVHAWYDPMNVISPDMNKPDWVIVMVWDFMPPADFQQAAANWKKMAEAENEKFPDNLTRRKLMKFVRKMQDRNAKK